MNSQQETTSTKQLPRISEKKLKLLLKVIKEEVSETNYKLLNTKKSINFNKLRMLIKQNPKKVDVLQDTLNQQVEKAIESRSLSALMIFKKIIQAFNFSQMVNAQSLFQLDSKINNYIFDNEEDPFQFYNTKIYQIIINNKLLFRNKKQLTLRENKKISIITKNQQDSMRGDSSSCQKMSNNQHHQSNGSIVKNNQDKILVRKDSEKISEQNIQLNENFLNQQSDKNQNEQLRQNFNNSDKKIIENEEKQKLELGQRENQQNNNNMNGSNEIKQNEELKTNEDIKLEELFKFIFPTLNDTFHQLTELENIIFLMSMTVNRQYCNKLKCTVYGSYMMGFQLSKSSDIDVSLEVENNPQLSNDQDSKIKFLTLLEQNLKQSDKLEINTFFNAPVPGFQVRKQSIFNSEYKVKIDFTVGNHIGIAKTSLLKIYSSLSIKIQQLVCLFKYFIQVKNIDKFTLSSIAQTNMVVFFLLQKNYVPNVQKYFSKEQQNNYLTHQDIEEADIKKAIEKGNLLQKLNSTPLFTLFSELISYYHEIVSQKQNNTLVISLLEPKAKFDQNNFQYKGFPFIIKEYYDQSYSIQPNIQFNFINFKVILSQTHQFIQNYDQSTQLSQFINQIFSFNTQNNMIQKNMQELIDEFNLEISSQDFDEDSDLENYYQKY